jgi:drug/metabolite transporter (DMT)-like permease
VIWIVFALVGALSQATYGMSVKVLLRRVSPYSLAGTSFLSASLVLLAVAVLRGIPPLRPDLPVAVAVTVTINIVATVLMYRALASTDLSLCMPMLAFTPVFLILTSFLILGELPTVTGAAGILMVACGAYLLNLEYVEGRPAGLSTPFRTLRWDRGVQSMLVVSFLFSISVNFDKQVVENSDTVFGSVIVFLLLGLAFLVITATAGRRSGRYGAGPVRGSPAGPCSDIRDDHRAVRGGGDTMNRCDPGMITSSDRPGRRDSGGERHGVDDSGVSVREGHGDDTRKASLDEILGNDAGRVPSGEGHGDDTRNAALDERPGNDAGRVPSGQGHGDDTRKGSLDEILGDDAGWVPSGQGHGVDAGVGGDVDRRDSSSRPSRHIPVILACPLVGLVLALEVVSINTAYTLAIVPYVITIKRLAIFFSVLYGGLLLGERQLGGRIVGAMVMIAGAAMIALFG